MSGPDASWQQARLSELERRVPRCAVRSQLPKTPHSLLCQKRGKYNHTVENERVRLCPEIPSVTQHGISMRQMLPAAQPSVCQIHASWSDRARPNTTSWPPTSSNTTSGRVMTRTPDIAILQEILRRFTQSLGLGREGASLGGIVWVLRYMDK